MRNFKECTILTSATTGTGNSIMVSDHRNCIVSVAATGTANLTIKCQGAIGASAPTFSSAASSANVWDYVRVVDLNDGSTLSGDTGIAFTGDDVRLFEININALDWITFTVTARSGGNVTVKAMLSDNV